MPVRDPCNDLPPPWTRRVVHFLGGLTGIGFAPDERHLLVVSHAGRGVIDLVTSELIARTEAAIPDSEFQEDPFTVVGIGSLAGVRVSCAGLWEGAELKGSCADGWRTDGETLTSPTGRAFALPEPDDPVRVVCFSPNELVFVYATTASLSLYYRVG